MEKDLLLVSRAGPVATLRINRPDRENRLNLTVLEKLCKALEEAGATPEVRAVILTGTGDSFCSGGDLAEFAAGGQAAFREFGRRFAAVHLAIHRLEKPILAAVNGDAFAGGMSLLASCDLAVARASARFAMPEIKAGLWPIMAMVSLNRALPRKRAFELYYFGDTWGVEAAREWGLVNWVVPDGEFDDAVRARGAQLATLPAAAVRIGRTTFAGIAERSYEDGFRYSAERLVDLLSDPDAARALAAHPGRARR